MDVDLFRRREGKRITNEETPAGCADLLDGACARRSLECMAVSAVCQVQPK